MASKPSPNPTPTDPRAAELARQAEIIQAVRKAHATELPKLGGKA